MNKSLVFIFIFLISIGMYADKKSAGHKKPSSSSGTNLHDFMEDYTKEAMKYFKKTGDRKYLNQLLPTFPELAIQEQREDWKRIVDKHLAEGKPESSCKSCHDLYKKDYKKNFRKREIDVPESIIGLDKEILAALRK